MTRFACVVCLACLMAVSAYAKDLVRDGAAVGEFVLASDASRPEVFAVTDVRHWIQEMTGATVPVLSTPSDKRNTKVFVGQNFATGFTDDLAKLAGKDGFAIRERDGNVYVFGSRPRGTMYGVFSLLERNSDIIWARPNATFGTVYGQHKDIVLNDTNVLDLPVFWYRGLGGGHPFHVPTGEWQIRNGNNHGGRGLGEPEWDMLSTIGTNLASPMAGHAKEHPEYFGYDPLKGARGSISHGEGTMCLTHPGLPKIWAGEVIKQIRAQEARTGRPVEAYLIGPGDNWFCCLCEECIKPIKLPDDGTLEMKDRDPTKDSYFRSTQIFMFLNEAMKTLSAEVPQTKIIALAYIHMAEPPAVAIDPNLLIYYAPYPTSTMHFPLLDPRQAPVWRTRFETWLAKTPNLGFYEYYYSKPNPLGFYAAENLKALLKTGDPSKAIIYSEFDNDRGARDIGENGLGWDVGAMNMWVIARLFWNPNQDVDGLYRYYIQRAYREAAPQMTEYYEMIKASWLDPEDKTWDGAHAGIAYIYQNMIVKKGLEAKTRDILTRAEAATTTPQSKTMIRRMRERYGSYSKGMNRLIVANVPELAFDGDKFESVQWEKAEALDEFQITRRSGEVRPASQRTTLKAGHDGKNLYLRFTAYDADIAKASAAPKDAAENFPKGDHGEVWFTEGATTYLFAFDCNGNTYDAKGYDRTWDSNWRVTTRKTAEGWEAIAVIPLDVLSLKPGQETKMTWHALREINHGTDKPEWISYRAIPLHYRTFPIVVN